MNHYIDIPAILAYYNIKPKQAFLIYLTFLPVLFLFALFWLAPIPNMSHNDHNILAMKDFIDFYGFGLIAKTHQLDILYHPETITYHLKLMFSSKMSEQTYGYPPHFLIFCMLLASLPLKTAYVCWLLSSIAILYFTLNLLKFTKLQSLFCAISPPALDNLFFAQNGSYITSFSLLSFYYMKKNPIISGVFMGLLTVKPQFGIVLFVYAIFSKSWKTIISATITFLVLFALSCYFFGLESWIKYITINQPYVSHLLNEDFSTHVPKFLSLSVFFMLRLLNVNLFVAYSVQIAVVLCVLVCLWKWWQSSPSPIVIAVVGVLASLLCSPYVHTYDSVSIAPACVILYQQAKTRMDFVALWFCLASCGLTLIGLIIETYSLQCFLLNFAFIYLIYNLIKKEKLSTKLFTLPI